MIKSFADKEVENIFNGINSQKYKSIQKIVKRKLDMINGVVSEQDLRALPANVFAYLDSKGSCAVKVNERFLIIFKFQNGLAKDVQIIKESL